jgi:hypothetical protein
MYIQTRKVETSPQHTSEKLQFSTANDIDLTHQIESASSSSCQRCESPLERRPSLDSIRKILAVALVAALAQSSSPLHAQEAITPTAAPVAAAVVPPVQTTVVLPINTPIRLKLNQNLSSATNQTNERIDFEVLEAVKVNNVVVIEQGATAMGTITMAEPKRRMGKAGKLDITLDNVRLSNGKTSSISAVKQVKGNGHGVAVTTGVVVTALVFWPAAPFFLLMHGKDTQIPRGTEITAYTSGDTSLSVVKADIAPQQLSAAN